MIVVNTGRSYPSIARRLLDAATREDALAELTKETSGRWPMISAENLARFADYVLGTCDGIVTVIYAVDGWETVTGSDGKTPKIQFDLVSPSMPVSPRWPRADTITSLIGTPQPGGPWKRGEARGTRMMTTPAELDVPRTTWMGAVCDAARAVVGPIDEAPRVPTMIVRPDGTVVVTVQAGTPVLVQTA